MPLEEDGKEFHLEVILKARALHYRIHEIPCVLEWKDYKHAGAKVARKSSSKVNRLIVSHTLFSIFANPIRYVWPLGALAMLGAVGFLIVGVASYILGVTAAYSLIVGLSLAIISLVFFTLGVIAYQGHAVQKEIWTMRREGNLRRLRERAEAGAGDAGPAERPPDRRSDRPVSRV